MKHATCILVSIALAVNLAPSLAFADEYPYASPPESLSTQAASTENARTAAGLFRYILDNAESQSPEFYDAQCAIDILNGSTDNEQDYPPFQGASQSSYTTATNGESNVDAYKSIDLNDPNDAVSLVNFRDSLDWIDAYNGYRAAENSSEGTTLSTNVGTNCRMMAISIVQCDWSKATLAHSLAYNVAENLAWGHSNPFDGWYTEEKYNYKSNNGGQTGHYLNVVDDSTLVTGFAVTTSGALYGICHEQSFDYDQPTVTYATDEFRTKWLNPYIDSIGGIEDATSSNINDGTSPAMQIKPAITLKASSKTVKAKSIRKKAQSFKLNASSGSDGELTYKLSKTNKRIKFNAKTGKVTLKKGKYKKGKSYSIKVKVSVAAKGVYSASSKTFKVSFKIR